MDFQKIIDKIIKALSEYGPGILLAVVTLVLGLWLIKLLLKILDISLEKAGVDETLAPFIKNLVSWFLRILLFISIASMMGVATSSFVAVLGAAGLAVGLALQGSLANFAGGFLVLTFKPYVVGDLIEAQGFLGVVKEVQIFNTILLTQDNRRIVIPNGELSNGSVINFSTDDTIRVDLVVGISYEANIQTAKDALMDMMQADELVLDEPAPFVAVKELADSSVNLVVRPWCKSENYWDTYFQITEKAKLALDEHGIGIPFPQRDVHLIKE